MLLTPLFLYTPHSLISGFFALHSFRATFLQVLHVAKSQHSIANYSYCYTAAALQTKRAPLSACCQTSGTCNWTQQAFGQSWSLRVSSALFSLVPSWRVGVLSRGSSGDLVSFLFSRTRAVVTVASRHVESSGEKC